MEVGGWRLKKLNRFNLLPPNTLILTLSYIDSTPLFLLVNVYVVGIS